MATSASKTRGAERRPTNQNATPRRDQAGHLNPTYARDLLEKSGRSTNTAKDDDTAFLRAARGREELSEERGENFVAAATSGEDADEERRDRITAEEMGGPYVVTPAGAEFASGTDESNPKDAEREPFPRTH